MKTLWTTAALAAGFCSMASLAIAGPSGGSNYAQVNLGAGVGGATNIKVDVPTVGAAEDDVGVKAGFFGSVAYGHAFASGLAVEAEGIYATNQSDTASLGFDTRTQSWGVLANVMYAIGQVGPVVPYVGAGVGVGHAKYSLLGSSLSDTDVIWQVRAGVSGDITSATKWDIGYRYLSEPEFNDSALVSNGVTTVTEHLSLQTHIHVVTVGVRQRF